MCSGWAWPISCTIRPIERTYHVAKVAIFYFYFKIIYNIFIGRLEHSQPISQNTILVKYAWYTPKKSQWSITLSYNISLFKTNFFYYYILVFLIHFYCSLASAHPNNSNSSSSFSYPFVNPLYSKKWFLPNPLRTPLSTLSTSPQSHHWNGS